MMQKRLQLQNQRQSEHMTNFSIYFGERMCCFSNDQFSRRPFGFVENAAISYYCLLVFSIQASHRGHSFAHWTLRKTLGKTHVC